MKAAFAASLAAVLYVLSFAPFDLAPCAWIALLPWCFMVRTTDGLRLSLLSYLTGAAILVGGCHWLALTSPVNLGLMVAVESLYFVLFAQALRVLTQRAGWPAWVALPVCFVPCEWLRRHFPLEGFPWLFLGYSQHDVPWFLAQARWGAVYATSALCAVTAGFALTLFFEPGSWRVRLRRSIAPGAVLVGLLASAATIGECSVSGSASFLLVQANIPQSLKNAGREADLPPQEILQRYTDWTRTGLAASNHPIDAVLWPETMLPFVCEREGFDPADTWIEGSPRFTARLARQSRLEWFEEVMGPMLRARSTQWIAGVASYTGSLARGDRRSFNSAILFDDRGEIRATVDKVLRVPGGEYLPLGWLPESWQRAVRSAVEQMAGFVPDLAAGDRVAPLLLPRNRDPDLPLGVSICYEVAYPDHQRALVRAGAEVLVNLSNEAWFPDSAEYAQYTAMAQFRAVELGRSMVRCANSGESGWVEPDGALHRIQVDGRTHDVAAAEVVQVSICQGNTPYSRVGDLLCWILSGAAIIGLWRGGRKSAGEGRSVFRRTAFRVGRRP